MIYDSVCSGIEAATVAWHPLGWRPAFFAEIEAFPSAVLKHHYPDVRNVGDFTGLIHAAAPVPSIDVLVGGTPCQSFSVAGLRRGLADARGGLTLEFVRLAQRLRPKWIVWENVPGVLSQDGGRAFGAFLGALGELGYGWAYRVLDAQYFGVAQRRRRVFVVGHTRGDFARAAAVLFEPEGMRRDPPTRRAAREGSTADAAGGFEVCGTLSDGAHHGGGLNGQDAYTGRVLPVVQCVTGERTHALKAEGADGSEDGTGRGTPIVTSIGFYPTEGRDFPAFNELSPTVKVGSGGTSGNPPGVMQAMAVETYNGTITGDVAVPLSTMGGAGNTGPSAMVNMAVRRLTPVECERLQGFPDDYTRIPWENKPASECPDGPRYKALGNSMAVPVMRWIGERIAKVEAV